jgi:hypothetical protein
MSLSLALFANRFGSSVRSSVEPAPRASLDPQIPSKSGAARTDFNPHRMPIAKHKKARRILADSSGCLANAKPTSLVVRQ